jgi:hypothetical protein
LMAHKVAAERGIVMLAKRRQWRQIKKRGGGSSARPIKSTRMECDVLVVFYLPRSACLPFDFHHSLHPLMTLYLKLMLIKGSIDVDYDSLRKLKGE